MQKSAVVLGGGGFIGHHLISSLKSKGYWVRGADLHLPYFEVTSADEFIICDLVNPVNVNKVITDDIDEVYQLAADMGGAGYIFTGENDANIMHNSATINLNVAETCRIKGINNVLYTSSACIYPAYNQMDPNNPNCAESSAYPAAPDSEYGWEKLFSERLYLAYNRNHRTNFKVVRLHNIFGEKGSWNNGKEKSPAALCRKVAMSKDGTIEVWGNGHQTRSFLYIDECIEGLHRIMESENITEPLNLGSEEMISINDLVNLIASVANKDIKIRNIPGPLGVKGRNSENTLLYNTLGWKPSKPLVYGIEKLYHWITSQLSK